MRRHLEDEDVERKALIEKIGDFLQKVLPGSTTRAGQAPSPPPETPDVRARVFKSKPPDTASSAAITPFMLRAHESLFASPAKRSLSADSDDEVEEAVTSYVPGESTVRAFSAQHFGAVASPYDSAYVHHTENVDNDF
jgi:hypothetical protein